jgi:hypothetical protein
LSHSASLLPPCSSILTFPQAHQSGSCLRTYTHTSASNTLPLTVHRSPSLQPQAFCLNTWAPSLNYARKQQHPWPYAFSYFSSYAYCHVVALCLLDTAAGFCPEKLFLWGIDVWTQDLELVRQALHHLSLNHNFCLFVLVIFQVRSPVSIWGQPQTTVLLPMAFWTIARITNLCHHIQLIDWGGVAKFLQRVALNSDSPNIYLPINWDYNDKPSCPIKNVGFGSWLGLFCPLLYASMIYWSKEWATHWWVMSGILATQEAEIRRITVQSQPWTNSLRGPISKKLITKKGLEEWSKW